MSKKPTHWIVSTLSAAMDYTVYGKGGGDIPIVNGNVRIEGGANIPDKYMRTPEGGVVTPITDEEMALLQDNQIFQLHQKNGFIKILEREPKTTDAGNGRRASETASSDMEGRDPSAPLVDQDFKEDQQPKPNARKA